ncbi:hypothetical protein K3G39_16520 [Pontibacter sp. HSC-14F20]|uniref:hypothetical protein n=1 Tax=Pontibacter sp. HSC-14F20 TaxID=2864136 RepID=UPI001C733810|nr:hypothetical protein [Pontibacter sp. HSC-14F20]MBX0334845.1 hypothetical protein [Pontibacter sp. HSC-14F20]
MNLFVDIGVYLKLRLVTYYTIRVQGEELSETDKFFKRFMNSAYAKDLGNIKYWLKDKIGEERGASERYFRSEKRAHALPPPIPSSDLRLYCWRCSDSVVLLGNGGVKTSQKAKDSPDCYPHFELMNAVVKEIKRRRLSCSDFPDDDTTIRLTLNLETHV